MKRFGEKLALLLTGDVVVSKKDLFFAATICLLAGIILGFVAAPLTHGVRIGCNNGNGDFSTSGNVDEDLEA